ncbi:hypothetical protein BaRGS_00003515 [Batillaria attramentaria]|uniref:Uncharacterized protein n=1 Tax=Batillaria attramentaria TaxID=370345 RepID=A0ABD0M222_9CAEN
MAFTTIKTDGHLIKWLPPHHSTTENPSRVVQQAKVTSPFLSPFDFFPIVSSQLITHTHTTLILLNNSEEVSSGKFFVSEMCFTDVAHKTVYEAVCRRYIWQSSTKTQWVVFARSHSRLSGRRSDIRIPQSST